MATKVSAEWFVRHYVERGPGDLNRARTILPTEEASWISVTREEQDFLNSKLRELRENRSLRRGQSASQVIGVPSPPTGEGALDPHEIVARGEGLYQQRLKTLLEKTKRGHYLVINVKTGEYVIETTGVAARKTFDKLYPGAPSYSLRIGIPISA